LEYKDGNFIPRNLGKICLVSFIIFLGTIKIGIIIGKLFMNLFTSPWELYSYLFPREFFSIPRNLLYLGIKFSKIVTNIGIYIPIILYPGIKNYNLKQIHHKD